MRTFNQARISQHKNTLRSDELIDSSIVPFEICDPENGSLKTEEWMNTEEAARYLRLSVGALRNLTSNGTVPYHKLGRRNRYFKADLMKLLFGNRKGETHER